MTESQGAAVAVMLPRDLPAADIIPFARRAEELGFAELWVVEDLGFRGGIAQAASVLASTSRIVLGIGILPAGARNAVFAAMELATLEQLFPGRLVAGIGHGMPHWMRSIGAWPASPLTLLEEYLTTVRGLLAGQRIDTADSARYVKLTDAALEPSSIPDAAPPVLAGVRGPKSLAVSGRAADGTILAEPAGPEYARAALGHIAAAGPHRLVTFNIGSVHPDATAAIDAARPGLAAIGEPDWAPHIEPMPFAAEFAALRADCASGEDFVERMPADWVPQLALAGTAAQVRDRLAELSAAGVTSSVFIPVGDPFEALESLATVL
ncbi:LLM class flavin-dependent oxidoreductase [Leifsonia flava]|nr:LLM class flavin-dependent oxidoreductase [Leifsonia flava]